MAPSTARHTGIGSVVIIIIPVDYLLAIHWSNGKEVGWFELPAAWRLNHRPVIMATVLRELLTGACILPQAGCLQIGAIEFIPEGLGIVPPPIVPLVAGFVKHLHNIYAKGSPPLPKRRTPGPAVRSNHLELRKAASHDWIKKDYIIKEFPCPLILDAGNIVYPYESTNVFRHESHHSVLIQ
jgi:hypothetical protein